MGVFGENELGIHLRERAAPPAKPRTKAENLRVSVAVLDQLMNRAGELVLARNELLQAISGNDQKTMAQASQRINMVRVRMGNKPGMHMVASFLDESAEIVRIISSSSVDDNELIAGCPHHIAHHHRSCHGQLPESEG